MAETHPEPSSFRDPAGTIVWRNGQPFRQVYEPGRQDYETLMKSGLYNELTRAGLLVPHDELDVQEWGAPDGTAYVLAPTRLPTISYPYEWSFSALQDAALLTLDVQQRALKYGMILKDASAYNVQFQAGRPVLIDTLSFEPYTGQRTWQAYGQFCRHFLAPLALMAKVDVRLSGLLREHIDGVPLDLAVALLPTRSKLRPGLLLHLAVHSASQKRYAHTPSAAPALRPVQNQDLARQSVLGLADSLARTIRGLRLPRRLATEWGEYYTFTNYSDEATSHKAKLVEQYVRRSGAKQVWDLGGNDGRFSRLALKGGAELSVCFDVDPLAVEKSYRQMRRQKESNFLPLLLDLTNPSPAIGWGNQERQNLSQRANPHTTVMALALIHHLAISNNLPFEHIAAWFTKLGSHLIIEFVPKTDSKVQTLLATRRDIFDQYRQDAFETAFGRHYEIIASDTVQGSERVMYLMRARHGG